MDEFLLFIVITIFSLPAFPVHKYAVKTNNLKPADYTFMGISCVLVIGAVTKGCYTIIPGVSPINEPCIVKLHHLCSNSMFEIYNRYGENVYSSVGYCIPWSETYKWGALPTVIY
jgi:hypothetical protein